ncbi:hypothetical protein L1987_31517 [Smallanthus sonchifolius]|uniref:Uncharacterized protein n=1 Tax=Smallanthus sonchifolius TaxID=185202 RepID=A0ACB9I7B6_9ASTR|nr:hypothetical protein L1987_31517 [Smallanthus sonchifolius]
MEREEEETPWEDLSHRRRRLRGKGDLSKVKDPVTLSLRSKAMGKVIVVDIPEETSAFQELYGRALVGRCVDVVTLTKLSLILDEVGFKFESLSYLGGLSILIKFEEVELRLELLNNPDAWSSWFSSLVIWQGQEFKFERIAWVKVLGVPLHLSTNSVFDSIAGKFGEVVMASQVSGGDSDLSEDDQHRGEDFHASISVDGDGSPENHDGGSIPQVSLRSQPQSEFGCGSPMKEANDGDLQYVFESKEKKKSPIRKPAILRPKKPIVGSPNGSMYENSRPKKRPRPVMEESLALDKFLGSWIFNGFGEERVLEEGEIREFGSGGLISPKALDPISYVTTGGSASSDSKG